MLMLFECWLCIAAAGVFGLPWDLERGPPGQLPPLTRYEPPTFPESLRLTSIRDGYVTMMFTIDGDGRVEDAVGLEASHPAFVSSMQEVLSKWRFKPVSSSTTPRRETIKFDFRRTAMVTSMSHRDASKSFFPITPSESERPIRTLEWADLAHPPQRLIAAAPEYPEALRARSVAGFATAVFVIDTAGRVRVPVISAASDPLFAAAALTAVKEWKFASPRQGDEPVNVLLQRTFRFGKP